MQRIAYRAPRLLYQYYKMNKSATLCYELSVLTLKVIFVSHIETCCNSHLGAPDNERTLFAESVSKLGQYYFRFFEMGGDFALELKAKLEGKMNDTPFSFLESIGREQKIMEMEFEDHIVQHEKCVVPESIKEDKKDNLIGFDVSLHNYVDWKPFICDHYHRLHRCTSFSMCTLSLREVLLPILKGLNRLRKSRRNGVNKEKVLSRYAVIRKWEWDSSCLWRFILGCWTP